MSKWNYTAEQIISNLREIKVKIWQGIKSSEAIRSIEVNKQTYSSWHKKYVVARQNCRYGHMRVQTC